MCAEARRSLTEYRRDLGFHLARRLNAPLVKPDWVSLMATLRCNLTCTMCRTCYDQEQELDTDEVRQLIDQVADWGVPIFNLLGGEPFLRRDILPILTHAHYRGLITTVTTNGTLLDDRAIEALAPLFRVHLNVSLDGLEQTHDRIRGAGVFAKATRAIRQLAEADAAERARRQERGEAWWPREITVNALVHRGDADELIPLIELARELGATGIQLLALFDYGVDVRESGLWFGDDDLPLLDRTVDRVLRWFEDGPGDFRLVNPPADLANFKRYYRGALLPIDAPCYNGFKELYINADGAGLMCDGKLEFLSDSFGNVREEPIRRMWASPRARRMRRKVLTCTHACTQDCYRRRESDSLAVIAAGFAAEAARSFRRRGRP
ncbi:MAG: radical SAM protein [Myxococcota bacterium]|jgi:MoaA/NifB/PqqE/SkfB family radical SAM enzyme|nr:radical SAM protein [Myxococcota bacterium]